MLIAFALGADVVLVGRPYVYGLAMGGEAGVEHVLRMLSDLDASVAVAGYRSVRELGREALAIVT